MFQTSFDATRANPLLGQLFEQYLSKPSGFLELFKEGVRCRASDLQNFGSGKGREFQRLSKECPAIRCGIRRTRSTLVSNALGTNQSTRGGDQTRMQRDAPRGAKLSRLRGGLFALDMTVWPATPYSQLVLQVAENARFLQQRVSRII
jgi:hypothetical protein